MANITDLGFTRDELDAAVQAGDVRVQSHPSFPNYKIHNYSEEVQFRNKWNKITLACRGLIIDDNDDSIVARPWEKFFNFGQRDNEIDSTAPVEVTDKLDGSLGILYRRPDGQFAIATRGSFASDQAVEGTAMLHETYRQDFPMFEAAVDNETFLFEIIYPANRIVVNYNGLRDLVLLGAVNKRYGYYMGPGEAAGLLGWNGPQAQAFHANDFVSALSLPDRAGREGYIIRSGNKIVKLKQADYVELHRIVTNLSPKTVWEMIGDGKTVDEICAGIPDEFYQYVSKIADELQSKATEIHLEVAYAMHEIMSDNQGKEMTRKDWALAANKYGDLAKYIFLVLDERDIRSAVWQSIKPRGGMKGLVSDED